MDPTTPGLEGTPRRWAKWWREFIEYDPGRIDVLFPSLPGPGGLVVVAGIEVWSLCEHHLLPFRAVVDVGYYPDNGQVLGLSKFARIAHAVAHKPQIQEGMTREIVQAVIEATGSESAVCRIRGEHLCMTMRGIKTPATMTTLAGLGRFEAQAEVDRFLSLVS